MPPNQHLRSYFLAVPAYHYAGPLSWMQTTVVDEHEFSVVRHLSRRLLDLLKTYLPHLHLAPLLAVTALKFHQDFGMRKIDLLGYCAALFAWSYVQPF